MSRGIRRSVMAVVALIAVGYIAVNQLHDSSPTPAGAAGTGIDVTTAAPGDAYAAEARGQLAALTVAPEGHVSYDREQWGDRWASHGDSCDTREYVLQLQGRGWTEGPNCRPLCPATGPACWTSPYDGVPVYDVADLQIDHLVPVAEANRSGTQGWTDQQRHTYYQDPTLLVAVTASSNTSKSDGDPARWRPPNTGVWCWYAGQWIGVKTAYHLTADPPEVAALTDMLDTCRPKGDTQ